MATKRKTKRALAQRGADIAATVAARNKTRAQQRAEAQDAIGSAPPDTLGAINGDALPASSAPSARAHDHLMVVRFTARQWYPRRFDKKASDEVAQKHGHVDATEIGRFNKILVELASIKPLQQAIHETVRQHYRRTAPWVDDGVRVLPARLYLDYQKELSTAKAEIARLARKFAVDEYEPQITKAKLRLNGLFNEADYPPAHEIETRFGISVHFEPLPDIDRVEGWGLDPDQTIIMQRELRESLDGAIETAQKHVMDNVLGRATEFVEKVRRFESGETRSLFETAITNVRDVVQVVLEGLNVTGDRRLTEFARDLDKALRGLEIEPMRDDKKLCALKAREVELISKRFAGVFGGGA